MSDELIIGCSDSLQMFPTHHQWAWDMFIENQANHWTPLDINMTPDVEQWRAGKLSDAEQHLFLAFEAKLTTFDVMRGDSTAECLQALIDPKCSSSF